jgi:hypothetical protein
MTLKFNSNQACRETATACSAISSELVTISIWAPHTRRPPSNPGEDSSRGRPSPPMLRRLRGERPFTQRKIPYYRRNQGRNWVSEQSFAPGSVKLQSNTCNRDIRRHKCKYHISGVYLSREQFYWPRYG